MGFQQTNDVPGEFEAGGESALQEEAHTGAEQILTFHGGMLWNVEEEHDMQLYQCLM